MSTENQSNSSEVKQATPASASERAIFVVCALAAVVMIFLMLHEGPEEVPDTAGQLDQQEPANSLAAQVTDQEEAPSGDQEKPRSLRSNYSNLWGNDVVLWWDDVPKDWRQRSVDTGTNSNIRLKDLAGSDSCWKCHEANYELWSEHGHSRMTTHASAATIVGDFSGDQSIEVEGGTAKFYRDGDRHLMKLIGNQNTSIYEVTRTIGWRHEQEYAGVLISDPTASSAQIEHVLPFSYDIAEQHWMPSIHVWPDGAIPDPFKPESIIAYTDACSDCHRAYPVGDRMFRRMGLRRWAAYTPRQTSFHLAAYLTDAHPEIMDSQREFRDYKQEEMIQIIAKVRDIELEKQVPLQGITCEACHYGCRDHVENSTEEFSSVRPAFYPVSPHLFTEAPDLAALHGRNTQNINFMCAVVTAARGRCTPTPFTHGTRPNTPRPSAAIATTRQKQNSMAWNR